MKRKVFDIIVYVLVFLAIQFVVTFGIQALWKVCSGSSDVSSLMLMVTMVVFNLLTIAVFLLARWAKVSRNYLQSRPWFTLVWCALAAVGMLIPSMWLQEQLPKLPNIVGDQLAMILKNEYGYVAVGLLAPIAEELVFRGAVLRTLLQWKTNHWLPIAISALIFSLVHGNPAQMPHAFLVGLLLGWMYYRTDSIVPGVVIHWVNNSVSYIFYNLLPDPDAPLVMLFGGSQRHVYLALLFSLCIFLPSLYQLSIRLKK